MVLVDVYLWIALILTIFLSLAGGALWIAAVLRRRRNRRMLVVSLTGLEMADAEEAQRRSFAYGNTRMDNEAITREMVDEAANHLDEDV